MKKRQQDIQLNLRRCLLDRFRRRLDVKMVSEPEKRFRYLLRRQDQVDNAGADGAARHPRKGGRLWILRDRDAAFGLDEPQPERSVAAGAGQHDGHRTLALILGERSEKKESTGCLCPRGARGLSEWRTPALMLTSWSGAMT